MGSKKAYFGISFNLHQSFTKPKPPKVFGIRIQRRPLIFAPIFISCSRGHTINNMQECRYNVAKVGQTILKWANPC